MMKCVAVVVLLVAGVAADGPVYIGCYRDNAGLKGRDLPVFFCSNGTDPVSGGCAADSRLPAGTSSAADYNSMTPAVCSTLCFGFKFFGVQFGGGCFCGNDYGNQGGKAPDSDCDTACGGDPSIKCGGAYKNSIYAQPSTGLNSTKAN
jgi:hypothetical protein